MLMAHREVLHVVVVTIVVVVFDIVVAVFITLAAVCLFALLWCLPLPLCIVFNFCGWLSGPLIVLATCCRWVYI